MLNDMRLFREASRVRQHARARRKLALGLTLHRHGELAWARRPFNGPYCSQALLTLPDAAGGWVVWPRSMDDPSASLIIPQFTGAGLATLELLEESPAPTLEARVARLLAAARWLRRQPEVSRANQDDRFL